MEDPIVHSHTEVPVVEAESRTQLEVIPSQFSLLISKK